MMQWSELQEKLLEIDLQEREIKRKREELWDQYIAGLPYKVGDKVRVTRGGIFKADVVCFIARIRPGYTQPEVHFNKMKADGTMSEVSAGIFYYDGIWVLQPAKGLSENQPEAIVAVGFESWADAFFAPGSINLNRFVSRGDAMANFAISTNIKTYSPVRFMTRLKIWATDSGYVFNPNELQNGNGRILRRNSVNEFPKEMLYIQTPGESINELLK